MRMPRKDPSKSDVGRTEESPPTAVERRRRKRSRAESETRSLEDHPDTRTTFFSGRTRQPRYCCYYVALLMSFCTTVSSFTRESRGLMPPMLAESRMSVEHQVPSTNRTDNSFDQISSSLVTSSQLATMTVPKLKDHVVARGWQDRGLFTRLKRKQQWIDFILDKQQQTQLHTQIPLSNNGKTETKTAQSKKRIVNMPRAGPSIVSSSSFSSDDNPDRELNTLERLFKKLYARYPPLKYMQNRKMDDSHDMDADPLATATLTTETNTGLGENDFRQRYHPMLVRSSDKSDVSQPVLSGDMDLIFVGTASCTPSVTRGVSCTALRLHMRRNSAMNTKDRQQSKGGTWLFDCGESTQLQVQRTSSIKPSKITKIFLTHAHGDHTFGLPGLLCLMGQDQAGMQNENTNSNAKRYRYAQEPKVIDIYGPDGLRMWLRVAIRYSVSRIVPPYRVHELKDIPMAPEWSFSRRHQRYFYNLNEEQRNIWGVPSEDHHSNDSSSWAASHHRINLAPSPQYGEVEGGRDIYPRYDHPMSSDGAPIWEVEDEGDVKVYAAPMSHGIPCVGYAVLEEDRPGRLRDEVVRPIILRNHDALKEAGFHHPMKAMQVIKELAPGSCFTFPDGTAVSQEEAVESPRPGRKVVICGDTSSARSMAKLAEEADVLVHEATNTFLFGFDKETNMRAVTKDAVVHGHSTPRIAGLFAKQVNANRLIMNHFSARYRGDATLESIATMTRIEEQALKASGLSQDRVAAAWDFMIFPVPLSNKSSPQEGDN